MSDFIKDPDDSLDYSFNWSLWLNENDVIANSMWIVQTGITKVEDVFDSSTTTIWISGGTEGNEYTATNRITTAAGRICDRTMEWRIVTR